MSMRKFTYLAAVFLLGSVCPQNTWAISIKWTNLFKCSSLTEFSPIKNEMWDYLKSLTLDKVPDAVFLLGDAYIDNPNHGAKFRYELSSEKIFYKFLNLSDVEREAPRVQWVNDAFKSGKLVRKAFASLDYYRSARAIRVVRVLLRNSFFSYDYTDPDLLVAAVLSGETPNSQIQDTYGSKVTE